jgi:HlyD family secretion protein
VKRPGRKTIIGIVIALIFIGWVGHRFFLRLPTVPVIQVKIAEIQGKVHGPGTVQSKVPVAVSTKITGILEKLYADQGDLVKKGQLLAEIDSAELRARAAAAQAAKNRAQRELIRAEADVGKARANLGLAQSNYQRDLEVFKPGYISKAAFDTSKAQLKVAESEVNASQATVTSLQAAVKQAESETQAAQALHNYTRILAPMSGLITSRKAEVGATVSPGTPIYQLVNLNTVWVAAWIDISQMSQIQENQEATIRLRSGRQFPGRVERINAEADAVTREMEVDVKFDQIPAPLIIGEEAEVVINTGSMKAPCAPLTAMTERGGQSGVLLVEQGRLVFRPVMSGLNDGKRFTCPRLLKEGDLIVIQPLNLKPGMRVRPEIKTPEVQGK